MRFKQFFFTIAALFALCTNAFSGYQHNSVLGGRDYCLDISDESGNVSNTRCKPLKIANGSLSDESTYFLIKAGAANGVSVSMATSDTTVDTSYTYVRKAIATDPAFHTGTLPDGKAGKLIIIEITELESPGVTWTLTPTTATGWSSVKFETPGDRLTLLFIDTTYGWVIISSGSCNVSYI